MGKNYRLLVYWQSTFFCPGVRWKPPMSSFLQKGTLRPGTGGDIMPVIYRNYIWRGQGRRREKAGFLLGQKKRRIIKLFFPQREVKWDVSLTASGEKFPKSFCQGMTRNFSYPGNLRENVNSGKQSAVISTMPEG